LEFEVRMPLFRRQARAGASAAPRRRSRGQSLAEFALVVPLMLLLVLFGIDFGRVFLGWVDLNNVVREAANFAAQNPDAWSTVNPNTDAQTEYARLVTADAAGINCALPTTIPAPTFPNGTGIGNPALVNITCNFSLITPLIGNVIGNPVHVSSSAAFPISNGIVLTTTTSTTTTSTTTTSTTTTSTTTTSTTTATCTVPNLLPVKAVDAQAAWSAAGFNPLPVLFSPSFPDPPPNNGGNIKRQSISAGTSEPCATTGITVYPGPPATGW
jgi:Flp pilus assembly protein TadG